MKRALFISVLLHLFLLSLLLPIIQSHHVGNQDIISSYLYRQPMLIRKTPQLSHNKYHIVSRHKLNFKYNIAARQHAAKNIQQKEISPHLSAVAKTGQNNKLLIMLHNQLQTDIADLEFNLPAFVKKRCIILTLMLHPDGSLTQIKIIKSTGMRYLDNQLVAAIANLSPLEIKGYLQHDLRLSLPICA